MPDAQIRPATPAPAVIANSRDTRVLGVHPSENHHTNGKAVQIGGGPGQAVNATMGAAGARVNAPAQGASGPVGTPKAQTGAVVTAPGTPFAPPGARAAVKATAIAPPQGSAVPSRAALPKGGAQVQSANALSLAEAALALDIVEGQVAQVIIANQAPGHLLQLAKDVVVKLRAQAGIPSDIPLPWDLAPPAIVAPVPVPVPESSGAASSPTVPVSEPTPAK